MAFHDGCLIIIRLSNVSKSREMVIRGPRIPPDFPSMIHPPPVPDLARVSALEVLGVSFSDRFSDRFFRQL